MTNLKHITAFLTLFILMFLATLALGQQNSRPQYVVTLVFQSNEGRDYFVAEGPSDVVLARTLVLHLRGRRLYPKAGDRLIRMGDMRMLFGVTVPQDFSIDNTADIVEEWTGRVKSKR